MSKTAIRGDEWYEECQSKATSRVEVGQWVREVRLRCVETVEGVELRRNA